MSVQQAARRRSAPPSSPHAVPGPVNMRKLFFEV
jgi:hypothetical protein